MSPFRELPPVELGPLDVGIQGAAQIARLRIPQGGRLIAGRGGLVSLHTAGALGSAGFLAVSSIALIGWLLRWSPHTPADVVICVGGVIAGGMSLAAVLRAVDRRDALATESGVVVGRAARRVVRRLARLGEQARTAPASFGSRRIAALRRALYAARSPEIARWVSADLRGRAALLLARAIAAHSEGTWMTDAVRAAEIGALLARAVDELTDPRLAAADLAAVKRRFPSPPRSRIAPVILACEHESDDDEAEAIAGFAPARARCR